MACKVYWVETNGNLTEEGKERINSEIGRLVEELKSKSYFRTKVKNGINVLYAKKNNKQF